MFMPTYMSAHHLCSWFPGSLKEGIRFPGSGIVSYHVGAGKLKSWKNGKCS